ncbi:MAG TPA: GGDEF domain-containing protein [Thermoanaerobaculia bacterium]|nr:GGDEF domain-containing protein [Thermoanaerobaculia bacterium]
MSFPVLSTADILLALTGAALAIELGRVRRRERRAAERHRDLQNAAHALAESFDPEAIAARSHEAAARLAHLRRSELYLFDENDRVREVWQSEDAAPPRRAETHPRLRAAVPAEPLDRLTATETALSFAPLDLQEAGRARSRFHLPLFSGRRAVGYWELEFEAPLPAAELDRLRGIYRSLTDAVYAESNFRLAARDALSNLFVRRYFDGRLESEILRAARYGHPLAVAVFDLDRFKAINDAHGHAAGDEVIRSFGSALPASLRAQDLSARRGGEEFAAYFPETDAKTALAVCERVRRRIADRPVRWEGTSIALTVSIGIAACRAGDTAETLLARADGALYEAKDAGRNRAIVARP